MVGASSVQGRRTSSMNRLEVMIRISPLSSPLMCMRILMAGKTICVAMVRLRFLHRTGFRVLAQVTCNIILDGLAGHRHPHSS